MVRIFGCAELFPVNFNNITNRNLRTVLHNQHPLIRIYFLHAPGSSDVSAAGLLLIQPEIGNYDFRLLLHLVLYFGQLLV